MKHNSTIEEAVKKLEARYGKRAADYIECIALRKELTYDDYIHTDSLLSLQYPLTDYHDEITFIIYHQQTELWFRLTLHEMRKGIDSLLKSPADVTDAIERVTRANRIMRFCTQSFDILIDGFSTDEFMEFRKAFGSSSGFQSAQFRVIEVLAGLERVDFDGKGDTFYWERAARSIETDEPTLTLLMFKQQHLAWLNRVYDDRNPHSLRLAFDKLLKEKQLSYSDLFTPKAPQLINDLALELAKFDQTIVDWKRSHLRAAAKHLAKAPHGTGETNWAEYLSRSIKEEHYFPEILAAEDVVMADEDVEMPTLGDA
jgi:tryptophan 2,3-dioxygenase